MERKSFGKPSGVGLILFTLFLGAMPTEAETIPQQSVGEQAVMLAQAPEAGKQPQPGEAQKPAGPEEKAFTSPEGKPLLTPEEVLKRKPDVPSFYGEKLLKLGVEEEFSKTERLLIKPLIKAFIPPLLQSAIAGDAFILPPNTYRVSVDYGFTNLTGRNDFSGGTEIGNFNGVRRQFVNLTLLYGFDLNQKFLHSFTAALIIPYQSTSARGFVEPAGPAGPQINNTGSVGALGDVSLLIKKKLIDQANYPVGVAVVGGVFFPTGSNSRKFGSNGTVSCSPTCPNGQPTFTFSRFSDDGRLPTVLQPGTGGAWGYMLGGFVTRQLVPGNIPFLAGTPFDRGAIHLGALHRWNFESNGLDPGGLTTTFVSVVAPVYKDYLSLEVTNLWQIQEEDSYRGTFGGAPRQPFIRGSTGLLGPSLIFSPDPLVRLRVTSLFRVKDPELGPSPPFFLNFGVDVTF